MRGAGLRPGGFVNLHIRHSVEKAQEGKRLHVVLPGLPAYDVVADALARDLGTRKVYLQTASPEALERFASFAAANRLELAFTNNTRSENDAWGGWQGGSEMEQAAVAAVNAHVGAQSAVSVSPDLSIWTLFLGWLFGGDGEPISFSSVCCPAATCRHTTQGGSNSLQIVAAPGVFHAGLSETRKQCHERPHAQGHAG